MENDELYTKIARMACDGLRAGKYELLGTYLPAQVLQKLAVFSGETANRFTVGDASAALSIKSRLLSDVLDSVRDYNQPNHRWCVLVKNILKIFELTRGSLCGADLSGLDLTECDFSGTALSSMGLSARFDGSLIRFDSFVKYEIPGIPRHGEARFAIDVKNGRCVAASGGCIIEINPDDPLSSRVLGDVSTHMPARWQICKIRIAEPENYIKITATNDLAAFDAQTSISPSYDGNFSTREWLFDGKLLIPCHSAREQGTGAVLRERGDIVTASLEDRELARFREKHCFELDTGNPLRDEISSCDREFSGDLKYRFANEKITERETRRPLAFIHSGAKSVLRAKNSLCVLNETASGCDFRSIHPGSVITPEQLKLLQK
jgi:hypothetical protein